MINSGPFWQNTSPFKNKNVTTVHMHTSSQSTVQAIIQNKQQILVVTICLGKFGKNCILAPQYVDSTHFDMTVQRPSWEWPKEPRLAKLQEGKFQKSKLAHWRCWYFRALSKWYLTQYGLKAREDLKGALQAHSLLSNTSVLLRTFQFQK